MSDPSSILIRLIDAAERTVCCRPPGQDTHELGTLVRDLQPPVGAPLSPAPKLLATALLAVLNEGDAWRVVVATLLPIVREDLSRVMEARKQRIEPDAYRGGHR